MIVRVAAVQPRTYRYDEEARNVPRALKFIEEAAKREVQIVSFPEGYPGPYSGPLTYSPIERLAKKAEECNVHVIAGFAESAGDGKCYVTEVLIGPSGDLVGKYRRVQIPSKPVNDVLLRKEVVPGTGVDLFRTGVGNVGILVCSEIYSPELSRVLAIEGADIIFAPVGGMIYELTGTWKAIAWARAIENHIFTVISQNLYGMEEGIAQIAGPEEILGELKKEGLLVADLDLDRLKWLRENEESLDLPKPYKVIPSLMTWRRPELYQTIAKPKSN